MRLKIGATIEAIEHPGKYNANIFCFHFSLPVYNSTNKKAGEDMSSPAFFVNSSAVHIRCHICCQIRCRSPAIAIALHQSLTCCSRSAHIFPIADTFETSVELFVSISGLFSINLGWDAGSGSDTITDFNGNEGDVLQIDVENTSQVVDLSSELSFNATNGQLKIDGNLLVTLENYQNFDVNTDVQFI